MIEFPMLVGSVGVGLLLLAFFLNSFNILMQNTKTYTIMNILGAGLACYASILIGFIPFITLEGTWAIIAVIGLVKVFKNKRTNL